MEEHLDLFSKAELIEGIKSISDNWYRGRLIINMFYKKQFSLLDELELNVAERRELVDKLKNTPKSQRLEVLIEIAENDKKHDKLQKQLDKINKLLCGGD